jgi:hypothetical protein
MKYEIHSMYDCTRVALAQSAFLTVWSGLGSWHEDLVLLGGLVPTFLCGDTTASRQLPRPVTLDIDLGIGLEASLGQYGSLHLDLQAQGFRLCKDDDGFGCARFVKTVGDFDVHVDFLTEHSGVTQSAVIVDSIPANVLPGVNRALATARQINVSGVDLLGAQQNLTVRICEVGPFLAMKLRAFARRQQPKDAFDVLYTLLYYDKGINAAATAFAEEVRLHNPACPDAIRSLERDFDSENSPAPMKAAHFVLGQAVPNEPADLRTRRLRIQQEMVDAGKLLKSALLI